MRKRRRRTRRIKRITSHRRLDNRWLLMGVFIVVIFLCGITWQTPKISSLDGLYAEVLEEAQGIYLPSFRYMEEGGDALPGEWIARRALNMIPLGSYVEGKDTDDMEVEDAQTYAMILEQQAKDENEVDAQGNLIGEDVSAATAPTTASGGLDMSLEALKNYEYLLGNFYTVDSSTLVTADDLNAEKLLGKDVSINTTTEGPKVLIYHTHSQEAFADSVPGDVSTTIMGMGTLLTELLNEKGIPTIHHEGVYDMVNGQLDRSQAYEAAAPNIAQILADNPSIEVVIDLHRDGVAATTHLATEINGKQVAQIMFFNGMSRTRSNGEINYLSNPYIEDNLAISLQMQLATTRLYPGFARRIYLKGYRYNMHLAPKCLLIEAGAQTNTVEEERNAMVLLAEVLHDVLIK